MEQELGRGGKGMAVKFKRPLLMGGLALTLGLWVWDSLQQSIAELGGVTLLGAMATGAGLWWFRKRLSPLSSTSKVPVCLERGLVERAIGEVEQAITHLELEAATLTKPLTQDAGELACAIAAFREQLAALSQDLDRKSMQVMVMGGKATGKTTLVNQLSQVGLAPLERSVLLQDTTALFLGTQDTPPNFTTLTSRADLVLFVTAGDLTEPEFQVLMALAQRHQRLLLLCNKQDQYLPDERLVLVQRSRQRMQQVLDHLAANPTHPYAPLPLPWQLPDDVVAVMANPGPMKVRQHQVDGSVREWLETPKPQTSELIQRLQMILEQEGQVLIWGTVLRSTLALKEAVQTELNQVWRDRAMGLVEQFQWIAAAAAFANPVPALDLLATSAVTAQLVLELGQVYKQKFSLQQAQVIAGVLANLLISLGLVELSTQLIGTLFKGNALTYVAGGALQGASAAYLTRLAGLSLMDYFHDRSLTIDLQADNPLTVEGLKQKLQAIFQQNRQLDMVKTLTQQALGRLLPTEVARAAL